MHYYQFNIADYRKDTGHLSTLEHGIYRQLLDWYYLDESPIPLETQVVIRRLRLGSESDIDGLKNVLNEFFFRRDTGYHQPRCDAEIREYQHKSAINKENGKLGGRPKKTQSVILGFNSLTESKPNQKATINHKPLTINHKPINNTSDDGFVSFYEAYPKKVGKPAAIKAWKAAKVKVDEVSAILGDIATRSQSRDWIKDDGQFIPNPATYLNQRRWEDQPQQPHGNPFAGAI